MCKDFPETFVVSPSKSFDELCPPRGALDSWSHAYV